MVEQPEFARDAPSKRPFAIRDHGLDSDSGAQRQIVLGLEFHVDQKVGSIGFLGEGIDADVSTADLREDRLLNFGLAGSGDADDPSSEAFAGLADQFKLDGIPIGDLRVQDFLVGRHRPNDPSSGFELDERFAGLQESAREFDRLPFRQHAVLGCADRQSIHGAFDGLQVELGLLQALLQHAGVWGVGRDRFEPLRSDLCDFCHGRSATRLELFIGQFEKQLAGADLLGRLETDSRNKSGLEGSNEGLVLSAYDSRERNRR